MSDKTCKTCKWWGASHPREWYDRSRKNHLPCEHPKNCDMYDDDSACGIGIGAGDMDVEEPLDTGPDFGCIHHEAKP